jgi:hypothetical protein
VTTAFIALALLVVGADVLLFDHPWGGLPVGLFLTLLIGAAVTFNRHHSDTTRYGVATGLGLSVLVALVWSGNGFATAFAWGMAGAIVLLIAAPSMAWEWLVLRIAELQVVGWLRLPRTVLRIVQRANRPDIRAFDLRGWAIPILLSVVFVVIFSTANPIFEWALVQLDPRVFLPLLKPLRVGFWVIATMVIWPFLRLGRSARPASDLEWGWERERAGEVEAHGLFGTRAILRSLVAFNLIFAMQTATDLGHFAGGLKLPEGMTLAEFAHRGAYPLMAAALVAAGFVLMALRDGAEDLDRRLRGLLLLFVAQGLLLVVTSIFRLKLYVAAYSLTQWRLAAFVWMGLVAYGFGTILVRIFTRRSNRWLKNVNAAAIVVALWGWSLIDDVGIIARWNFSHAAAFAQSGSRLDEAYLMSLGVRIVPALDAYLDALEEQKTKGEANANSDFRVREHRVPLLRHWRADTVQRHLDSRLGWRSWSVSGWRLDRYLSTMPTQPAPAAQ